MYMEKKMYLCSRILVCTCIKAQAGMSAAASCRYKHTLRPKGA